MKEENLMGKRKEWSSARSFDKGDLERSMLIEYYKSVDCEARTTLTLNFFSMTSTTATA